MSIVLLLAILVALAFDASRGATRQDVATLQAVASDLGIPAGLWNLSVDPCVGRWPGVGCCTNTSSKRCCTSPVQVYSDLLLDCETSSDADIALLLLRSDVIKTTLNGTLTSSPCNLSSLLLLDIGLNKIDGTIPACLGGLNKLQVLRLGSNRINGSIPREVGNLSNLQELFLDTLELTGEIPDSFSNLTSLVRFVLRNNRLQGSIPARLGQLSQLSELQLQMNNLTGSIPSSMSGLLSVTILVLAHNSLTGQLNATMFNGMTSLRTLNLSFNGFSGPVPDIAITGLTLLDLGFNRFTGSMPAFQGSTAIRQLFLGHNSLTGAIPAALSAATMTMLDLSHNQLTGPVEKVLEVGSNIVAGESNIASNIAFNSIQDASRVLGSLGGASSLRTVFNCVPAPSCNRSSPGRFLFFAANAGGPRLEGLPTFDEDTFRSSSLGLFYGPDSNWAIELSGTSGGAFSTTEAIRQSTDGQQALYQSMRWCSTYIAFHGVGLETGNYTVTLYFAEIIFNETGYREFDVFLNGRLWRKKLDIVKETGGPRIAFNMSTTTSVSNGTLSVELVFAGKDITIVAGQFPVVNTGPMISAISVINTNFNPSGARSTSKAPLVVPVVLGPLLIILLIIGLFFWRRRRRGMKQKQLKQQVQMSENHPASSAIFTYKELYEATRGFTEKLGEGGFGVVYKGTLPSGVTIAVKQLIKHENKQVEDDFKKEISILSKVRHKNLLSVLGHSLESDVPMLVTEFIPNGSLDRWLLKQRRSGDILDPLSWEVRRSVAIGVACGLAYLHEESKERIIHCDVKPANILLDSDMNPRLGDFGLARLYDEQASHVTATRLKGTAGYLAPEYAMHLKLSDKVDVYSFGVVLLELLSGRRAVDFSAPSEECVLVEWVHREAEVPENMLKVIDKRLGSSYDAEQAKDMATVAILCTQRKPELRPRMQTVWLMLNGSLKVPEVLASLDSVMQGSSSSTEVNSFEYFYLSNAFLSSSQ